MSEKTLSEWYSVMLDTLEEMEQDGFALLLNTKGIEIVKVAEVSE